MGKVVSITRVLNEDDIIESFVRHNSSYVDHMLFIDDGSSDETVNILKLLQDDGFSLTLFRNPSLLFQEVAKNTWGYNLASKFFDADWVLFIDADEFLQAEDGVEQFRSILQTKKGNAILIQLVNYAQMAVDDATEVIVPKRIRWHTIDQTSVYKLVVRGKLKDITIGAGNHGAFVDGNSLHAEIEDFLSLAHYSRRHIWQVLQKIVVGRMKVISSGKAALDLNYSSHYLSPFETLRDKPAELIYNAEFAVQEYDSSRMMEDPLNYLGGSLKYCRPIDYASKAISNLLNYFEALARQHGMLIDSSQSARAVVVGQSNSYTYVF